MWTGHVQSVEGDERITAGWCNTNHHDKMIAQLLWDVDWKRTENLGNVGYYKDYMGLMTGWDDKPLIPPELFEI